MLRLILILLSVSLLFSGCASTYRPIAPNLLNYDLREDNDGLNFGYRYDVLSFRGNHKYAKREPKKMIRLVAVKIENHTGHPLKVGENFNLYAGQNQVFPIDPEMIHTELKQGVPIYLLYSLLWFSIRDCDEYGNCETTAVIPIGIPITIGNMLAAGSANTQFKMELLRYNLLNKVIDDGETVYGLVGIANSDLQPLRIVLKD